METDTLTIRQAFHALIFFLEREYDLGKSEDILNLLSYLVDQGDRTADPAYWSDWMRAVERVIWPDSLEKQNILKELISDPTNIVGIDQYGSTWYAHLLPDGKQVFASVLYDAVQYASIRKIPKVFQPGLGLSSPQDA